MKDNNKLITTCVVSTALFVSPWALICALGSYATWKFLDHEEKQKQEEEEYSDPAENVAEKEEVPTPSEKNDFTNNLSEKDIDSLLNEDEEDPFAVKDPI